MIAYDMPADLSEFNDILERDQNELIETIEDMNEFICSVSNNDESIEL